MALYAENIDKKWGRGTANKLYQLSKKIKQWDVRELGLLADAARRGFIVYKTLYD